MSRVRVNPPANAAEEIERLATLGYSTIGVAKSFKVAQGTVLKWFEREPELKEAYEMGRDTCRQALEEQVRVMGLSGKNPAGLIYLLKAKFKMYDIPVNSTKVDVRMDNRQPVMVVKVHGTDEDWQAAVSKQQQALLASHQADAQRTETSQRALPASVEPTEPESQSNVVVTVAEAPSWVPRDARSSAPGKRSPANVKWKRNA